MRTICFTLILLAGHYAGLAQKTDTVRTISAGKATAAIPVNKLFYEKNVDGKGRLLSEGLRYNNCYIGIIKYYWPEGGLKELRSYRVDDPTAADQDRWAWMKKYRIWDANRQTFLYPENWIESAPDVDKTAYLKELEKRGRCNIPDGEWKTFDRSGNLLSTEKYEKGKRLPRN